MVVGSSVRGVTKGAQFLRCQIAAGVPNDCGGMPKSPKNVISSFFKRIHLLPKGLRFEPEGIKLASYPRRHLSSSCPCLRVNVSGNPVIVAHVHYVWKPIYTISCRIYTINKHY